MSNAEYNVKLRQQYQANMDTFAEKEIEKEKAKEIESATEHFSKEKKKVISVELEEFNEKNNKKGARNRFNEGSPAPARR